MYCVFFIILLSLSKVFINKSRNKKIHIPLPVVTVHKEIKYWQETAPKRKMFLCKYDPGNFLVCINPQCTNNYCIIWSDPDSAELGELGQSALVSFPAATDHMHILIAQAVKNKAH